MFANVSALGNWACHAAPAYWERFSADLKRAVLPAPARPNPAAWGDTGLYAAWLGHATVLLKVDGVTILTDPVFSTRVGLGFGPLTLGLKRLMLPALPVRELPNIDVVLLSHAHFDHFDLPSLRRLAHPSTTVVTARHTADLLPSRRWREVHELGW